MKRKLLSLLIAGSTLAANAANIITSPADLRLSGGESELSFRISIDENLEKIKGKTGSLKAKIKFDKTLFDSNIVKVVNIPYVNGEVSQSDLITLSLKDGVNITDNLSSKLKINIRKRKKFDVKKFKDTVEISVDGIEVSGQVTAPISDIVTSSRNNTSCGDVNFYALNPNGTKNGEPLVTAPLQGNGSFSALLPTGTELGSNLLSEVQCGDEPLRALVGSDEVNVSPGSEFVYRQIEDNGNFANFSPDEINDFQNRIGDFGFDFLNDDLEEIISKMGDQAGSFFNNMLNLANEGNGNGIESDNAAFDNLGDAYNVAFFDQGIGGKTTETSDNEEFTSSPRLTSSIQLAGARISKPSLTGVIRAFAIPILEAMTSLQKDPGSDDSFNDPSHEQQPPEHNVAPNNAKVVKSLSPQSTAYRLESEHNIGSRPRASDDNGNFLLTADPDGTIIYVEPALVETFHDDFLGSTTFESQAQTEHFYPVGGPEMYISSLEHSGTQSLASGEAFSNEFTFGIGNLIKFNELTNSDIASSYGVVSFSMNYEAFGQIETSSFSGLLTSDTTGFTAQVDINDIQIDTNASGGFDLSSENVTEVSSGRIFVKKGRVNLEFEDEFDDIEEDQDDINVSEEPELGNNGIPNENIAGSRNLLQGFARSDARVITFVGAEDKGNYKANGKHKVYDTFRELVYAVKPAETPDPTGTYRLLCTQTTINENGGMSMAACNHESAQISFDGTNASISNLVLRQGTRASEDSAVVSSSQTLTDASAAYTISSDKKISFTLNGLNFTGFAAEDNSLIVLKATNGTDTIGLYIAVPVNS